MIFPKTIKGIIKEKPMKRMCIIRLSCSMKERKLRFFDIKTNGRKKLDAIDTYWLRTISRGQIYFSKFFLTQLFLGLYFRNKLKNPNDAVQANRKIKLSKFMIRKEVEIP